MSPLPSATQWPKIHRIHRAPVSGLTFSRDQPSIITCSWDGSIRCSSVGEGVESLELLNVRACLHAVAECAGVIFCSDEDGHLHSCRTSVRERKRHRIHHAPIYSLDPTRDGSGLLISLGGFDYAKNTYSTATVALWDTSKEEIAEIYRSPAFQVVQVTAVRSSPIDRRLLAISTLIDADGLIRYHLQEWRPGDAKPIRDIPLPDGLPLCVDYSPTGRHAAVGSGEFSSQTLRDEHCNILILDLESESIVETCQVHDHAVSHIRYHPDGQHIVSSSLDQLVIHTTRSMDECQRFRLNRRITSLSLSSDGMIAAAGLADGRIALCRPTNLAQPDCGAIRPAANASELSEEAP